MTHPRLLLFLLIALTVFLTACNTPTAEPDKTATPAVTPAVVNTAAVEAEIKQLEQGWIDAEIKKDRAWYDSHLADNFLATGSDGSTENKASYIAATMKPNETLSSGTITDMRLQVHGDAVVANYQFTATGSGADGAFANRQLRFTDVWLKRNNTWQVVASHGSRISPPLSAKASSNQAKMPAPTATPTDPDAQQIIQLEIDWGTLTGKSWLALVERIETEEYFYTDDKGQVFTKAQDIASSLTIQTTKASRELKDTQVTKYGDVAVITALCLDKSTRNDGNYERTVRFTDVWVKRNGNWLCAASHSSNVTPARFTKKS